MSFEKPEITQEMMVEMENIVMSVMPDDVDEETKRMLASMMTAETVKEIRDKSVSTGIPESLLFKYSIQALHMSRNKMPGMSVH